MYIGTITKESLEKSGFSFIDDVDSWHYEDCLGNGFYPEDLEIEILLEKIDDNDFDFISVDFGYYLKKDWIHFLEEIKDYNNV